jgi:hypothetical protein
LNHLLAGNEDSMPLPELLLQPVKGKVIVVASQHHVHGQSQPKPALRHQPWRKRSDGHTV